MRFKFQITHIFSIPCTCRVKLIMTECVILNEVKNPFFKSAWILRFAQYDTVQGSYAVPIKVHMAQHDIKNLTTTVG
jgi:hypothetical protein